ncbi:SMC-Scp complex subunit ScpB [Candidatus Kaiserbacteria bacterium]|nr:SMC-Scp complex subunit ScpB [Candidatus Kaiserbacteria bacterium]
MNADVLIEAVLFYRTEPVTKKELGEFLGVSEEELSGALASLGERLSRGAARLIDTGSEVQLASAPEVSEIVEKLRKEELSREIGKAGAETLAIVLYRGPVSRAQIDYIRGVNSGYILRNLQVRGLVERVAHKTRAHAFEYAATPALYAHMGIAKKEDLPRYATVMDEIDVFENNAREENMEAIATSSDSE